MEYNKVIRERLAIIIEGGSRKLILYPFGEQGKLAKCIMNTYFGINEIAVVDNLLSKEYPFIDNLEGLKNKDISDAKILLTSDRVDIHDELLQKLYAVLPNAEVLELFPDWLERGKALEKEKNELEREHIRRDCQRKIVLDKVREVNLVEAGMLYSLINSDVTFFLPYVYMDAIQATILISENYYEKSLLDWVFFEYENGKIASAIRENDRGIVLDIGANIGNHSLYFVKEVGAKKVISFEPIEETYWILEKNVEVNGLQDKIEIRKVGLSDKQGTASIGGIYCYENIGGMGIDTNNDGNLVVEVLDDFSLKNVLFMKIDVEGMEAQVLKGALQTIIVSKPYILVESFPKYFEKTNGILTGLGYQYIALPDDNYLYYYE